MRGKREHQSKETLRFKELYGMMMKKLEIELTRRIIQSVKRRSIL